jgi:hypothetical protein
MYDFKASAFYEAAAILRNTIAYATRADFPSENVMTEANRGHSTIQLNNLMKHVTTLQANVTALAIEELLESLSKPGIKYIQYARLSDSVDATLRRELKLKTVLVLDAERQKFYDAKKPLLGDAVATAFPSLSYEISEIGNCYAVDRTTASAFHSIRCLEAGIGAITRCLGIDDPTRGADRNWGNIQKRIREEMEKRWPASSGRMHGDARLFDDIFGALAGMQNPYRNATMHLDARYDAPEALHIYEVVKGLMTAIALRMDERGEPKA